MALDAEKPLKFKFTDKDGDEGVWHFSPTITRGLIRRIQEEFPDGEEQGMALLRRRTVGCSGAAFVLTRDHEVGDATFPTGTVMPLDNASVREYFIDDVIPLGIVSDAAAYIAKQSLGRSSEAEATFPQDGEKVVGGAGGGRGDIPGAPAALAVDAAGAAPSA